MRRKKGEYTIDNQTPEKKAPRMRNRKWDVYEVGQGMGYPRRNHPSSGGLNRWYNRIGEVSAPDHPEAISRAHIQFGEEHTDYVQPRGHYKEVEEEK